MWNWLGITNDPKKPTEDETSGDGSQTTVKNTDDDVSKENETMSTEKKVAEAASNLTNYLYNFADKASKTATQLKESVDKKLENTIVGDFNKENEKFVQERDQRRVGDAVPPWVGFHEEEVMKSQIIALSSDERNFLRDPPSGVEFQCNLEQMMPVALTVLKEDADLEKMRFKLVPKRIKEERFWRNYFYRVSLIKQSTQLSSLTLNKDSNKSPRSGSSESLNKSIEKSSETSPRLSRDTPEKQDSYDNLEDVAGSPTTHEFVSDAFDDNAHLSEEEKTQMLGLNDKSEPEDEPNSTEGTGNDNEDWELDKELQQELESFELVNDGDDVIDDNGDEEWQKEIEELLDEDGGDVSKKEEDKKN